MPCHARRRQRRRRLRRRAGTSVGWARGSRGECGWSWLVCAFMPLDPQLQPILDLLGGELQVEGLTPDAVRAASAGGLAPRDETGLAGVEDIKVAGAEGMLPARVYRPEGVPSPAPVVVFFHGGGWTI